MAFFKKKEKVVEITPQPKIETLSFTVRGIKYKNPDGSSRKDIIEAIANDLKNTTDKDDLFRGYTNKEIKEDDLFVGIYEGNEFSFELEEYEFEGKPAYYVITDFGCVGVVPESIAEKVHEFSKQEWNHIELYAELWGGQVKCLNHGNLITKETPYSVECTIRFYPNV